MKSTNTQIIRTLLISTVVFFSSCEDKRIPIESSEDGKSGLEEKAQLNNEELLHWITLVDIDAEESSEIVPSFQFATENEEVQTFLVYKDGVPIRLDEKYSHYTNKTYGTRYYYLQNDQVILSKEVKDEMLPDSSYQMRETITYYTNNQATMSQTRTAPYEEELILASYTETTLQKHPFSNALDILNNEGEYVLYFKEILETENASFVVLSTKSAKGYLTAVMLEYRDDFANQLLSNKKKHKGKAVAIDFEIATDNGMTYQAYRGGRFLD